MKFLMILVFLTSIPVFAGSLINEKNGDVIEYEFFINTQGKKRVKLQVGNEVRTYPAYVLDRMVVDSYDTYANECNGDHAIDLICATMTTIRATGLIPVYALTVPFGLTYDILKSPKTLTQMITFKERLKQTNLTLEAIKSNQDHELAARRFRKLRKMILNEASFN